MAYPLYQNYVGYNPLYFQQPQQNVQQAQIQNGGLVLVKDMSEAMNYPVAPGHSVTFKNETQPYIYTKTLGISQLDQPIFEIFKLVKEEREESPLNELNMSEVQFLTLDEGNALKDELEALKSEIQFLKELIAEDDKEDESK